MILLCWRVCYGAICVCQAVGASVRIFELMDRQSEVKDGDQIHEPFGRGVLYI